MKAPNQQVPNKGAYLLLIHIDKDTSIKIGALGKIKFKKGYYVYIGSAMNNLTKRIDRHLKPEKEKTTRWHIDYLRVVGQVTGYFYTSAPVKLECRWFQAIRGLPEADIPLPGFGSSDCTAGCQAHLLHFPEETAPIDIGYILLLLESSSSPHPVSCVLINEPVQGASHGSSCT